MNQEELWTLWCWINSLTPRRYGSNFKSVISKHMLQPQFMNISCEIVTRRKIQNHTDDKSTLVQVMAWCHQATSHYLNQSGLIFQVSVFEIASCHEHYLCILEDVVDQHDSSSWIVQLLYIVIQVHIHRLGFLDLLQVWIHTKGPNTSIMLKKIALHTPYDL